MSRRISNVNDWMIALAQAIEEGTAETVADELENISYGWLQDEESRGAQLLLLDSVREMVLGNV